MIVFESVNVCGTKIRGEDANLHHLDDGRLSVEVVEEDVEAVESEAVLAARERDEIDDCGVACEKVVLYYSASNCAECLWRSLQ